MAWYPARADVPWEVDAGRVVVEVADEAGPLEGFLRRVLGAPTNRLWRLDEHASRAWVLLDGTTSAGEVAAAMAGELGDPIEEAETRLKRFLGILNARDLVVFHREPRAAEDPLRGFPQHERATCACGHEVPVRLDGDRQRVRFRCPACGERGWAHVA